MQTIEIARRLAELDQTQDACNAYTLALHQGELTPEEELEAAVYILQTGGDYKVSYTTLLSLFNRGMYAKNCLEIMTEAFYTPNFKLMKSCYEKNCKALSKYPYLFRKDFPAYEDLPIRFYPFDDSGYVPFFWREQRFGEYIDFKNPVVSRNFFKDLERPILADDVYSQYELEYLHDNVRASEYIGRENHVYLHYTSWPLFCAYLQCINIRPLLGSKKLVFLVEDEIEQYPIDFKARFGIDYSSCPLRPVGIREVQKLVWHTQLSSHNGGDFFNEIFDAHPNLLSIPSVFMDSLEESVAEYRKSRSLVVPDSLALAELTRLHDVTDKDILVALHLQNDEYNKNWDQASRIVPAIFLQPHFGNLVYNLSVDDKDRTTLNSAQFDKIHASPMIRGFKYIKTFTPLRRPTTSYAASIRFAVSEHEKSLEKHDQDNGLAVLEDSFLGRIMNRSFMIDWQDRLFKDSVLVRFEDGKLNPKATFSALAAFLDIPYTESMTYCSQKGERDPESLKGNARGFDPVTVYRTYEEFASDTERYLVEYFFRDLYAYCGYDFQYYDNAPLDDSAVLELSRQLTTIDRYIGESWLACLKHGMQSDIEVTLDGKARVMLGEESTKMRLDALQNHREKIMKVLNRGLYFVNRHGQPLHMMPRLELNPALLEQPLYH
ncbi:MAG: hypothetical protein HFF38_09185 [Lawsonibacter sp.]|nr:hypothetical protein [Lawsonibacter sp.]